MDRLNILGAPAEALPGSAIRLEAQAALTGEVALVLTRLE
jgi:hypothetical protein